MRAERGAVLLEVLVALMILATAGAGLVSTLAEHLHAVELIRSREVAYSGAEGVLARLSLRDRNQLDIRIGRRVDGGFVTDIQRPRPTLYRISVRSAAAPEDELLVTIVYRAEAP